MQEMFGSISILLLLALTASAISAEPICNLRRMLPQGYMAICHAFSNINTSSAIDQLLINLASQADSNITYINIHGEGIHLSASTLRPFKELDRFVMDGQNGTEWSRRMDSDEQRSTIESNAFVENNKLENFYVVAINFPNMENLRSVFQPLFHQLTEMQLFHCSFSLNIDPFQVFNQFTKLHEVKIEYSDVVSKISANAFEKSSQSLQYIRLSNNKIASIDRNAFKGLNKMHFLELDHNEITIIESGTFDDLTSIKRLDVSNNRISKLPNILFGKSADELRVLALEQNKLTLITANTLKGLKTLVALYLQENQIESIEQGSFNDLVSLKRIYLQNNRISQLPSNLFENTQLRIMNITNNPIGNISPQNFTGPATLREIIVSE